MESYPTVRNPYAQMWAHTRNAAYVAMGHTVDVFVFSGQQPYRFQGVSVYPVKHIANRNRLEQYDVIVVHQPNLRDHLRFLIARRRKTPVVYFFHGHEALISDLDYPPPYPYMPAKRLPTLVRRLYDRLKVRILRRWFESNYAVKSGIVFVSNWMKNKFIERVGIDPEGRLPVEIIPNPVNPVFIERSYNWSSEKERDFICLRQLDQPKHSVDKVVELAEANPHLTFTIYGKGRYFLYNKKPSNVEWIDRYLLPEEMPDVFDRHRCAVMPTRVDSQGVMMCEMATYGIPVITTDLDVCRDALGGFRNVMFLGLNDFGRSIDLDWVEPGEQVDRQRYDPMRLARREIEFFHRVQREA